MCLRFVFLLITRMTSWLRPFRREEAWKTAEILILRHQLDSAAPLKPLPEPVDLEQYRVRRHARVGGMINEYQLVA
jgi:hypothetical protein